LAPTEDPQLLDTTNGPLTMTLLMFTAELPLLDRVKVNQAVPVPTGVLPKFWLDGLRVTVWAMSVNGASNEMTTRVSMRLHTKLIGILLCFICRYLVSEEARRTPARAIRPLFWVIEGIVESGAVALGG
jgi:hypothetical protein